MGHINLQEVAYVNLKENERTGMDLNSLVDVVVYELVTKNAKMINDVERNTIPQRVLEQEIVNYLDANRITLEEGNTREILIKKVKDYLFGYGPLQDLLNNSEISDIKILDINKAWVKIKGRRYQSSVKFSSRQSLLTYCYYLCYKNGGNISELNAIQKLSDPETHPSFILRINVCIQPVNRKSPSIHIRKIPKNKPSIDTLQAYGMMNDEICEYLVNASQGGLSMLWCGKGGSGKTYLMNACMEEIRQDKSVLVMQETEELHSNHPNMEFQVVKYKSGESEVEYTLRTLTINGLLRDVDYMIIGEIKGPEAMDLFNACYTGHVAWASIHSFSAKEALDKAVDYMKYSGTDLKKEELLKMLSKVDVVIYMRDFKCCEIIEIAGFDDDKKQIIYNPVFIFAIDRNEDGSLIGSYKRIGQSCSKIQAKLNMTEYEAAGGGYHKIS